jgi:hypothetical protein
MYSDGKLSGSYRTESTGHTQKNHIKSIQTKKNKENFIDNLPDHPVHVTRGVAVVPT